MVIRCCNHTQERQIKKRKFQMGSFDPAMVVSLRVLVWVAILVHLGWKESWLDALVVVGVRLC